MFKQVRVGSEKKEKFFKLIKATDRRKKDLQLGRIESYLRKSLKSNTADHAELQKSGCRGIGLKICIFTIFQ